MRRRWLWYLLAGAVLTAASLLFERAANVVVFLPFVVSAYVTGNVHAGSVPLLLLVTFAQCFIAAAIVGETVRSLRSSH